MLSKLADSFGKVKVCISNFMESSIPIADCVQDVSKQHIRNRLLLGQGDRDLQVVGF